MGAKMKIVKAENIDSGVVTEYLIPSIKEAIQYSKRTWGSQYDDVEKMEVHGGLPMLWERK